MFPGCMQPRDLWSAGRREKEGKDKMAAVEEEEDEDEDMEEGDEEEEEDEDDHDREEDGTVAVTARMDHQPAERVRRASAPAMIAPTPTTTFRPAPSQWSVEEVTAFITTLPGRPGTDPRRQVFQRGTQRRPCFPRPRPTCDIIVKREVKVQKTFI